MPETMEALMLTAKLGLSVVLLAWTTATLAQTHDRAPVGLQSSARMSHDRGESWTYFKPGLNLSAFRNVIVEPTVVYAGPDAQFDGIDAADRRRYANIVTERLRRELAGRLGTRAAPGTAR